jgi:hypothetical protein
MLMLKKRSTKSLPFSSSHHVPHLQLFFYAHHQRKSLIEDPSHNEGLQYVLVEIHHYKVLPLQ